MVKIRSFCRIRSKNKVLKQVYYTIRIKNKKEVIEQIRNQYGSLVCVLDERSRRQWAATEVEKYGRGGLRWVCEATEMSHNTVIRGMREIRKRRQLPQEEQSMPTRIRQKGGGRKLLEETDPELLPLLRALVEPASRGDPMKPLCWTTLSTYTLAEELTRRGHPVSPRTVTGMLKADNYRLQSNRKTAEEKQHPDRNEQFEYINRQLVSHEVMINLIANTRTKNGLKISAELDTGNYPTGKKISDEEIKDVKLKPSSFHGDWNYSISP
jgi:hypothetical protein